MLRIAIILLSLFVPDVVGSTDAGNVRSRSAYKRLIFDSNHKFTGWASWEQYAACSTRCVTGYETETSKCCDTGDNRLCYNLPWENLRQYIGSCQNVTTSLGPTKLSSTPAPTTSATKPSTATTTTKMSTTTSRLTKATTVPGPYTLPPKTTTCAVCAGPMFLCEQLYIPTLCQPPNNYCINKITNHKDGTKSVERACGNFDTCYREWYQGTSDNDHCLLFDGRDEQYLDFQCTFCCVKDDCNIPLHPSDDTLYRSRMSSV